MKNKFYITTTLPYVNADPHVGFAREIIEADVLARFHREMGDEVFFNTGTDEHGQKIKKAALYVKENLSQIVCYEIKNYSIISISAILPSRRFLEIG